MLLSFSLPFVVWFGLFTPLWWLLIIVSSIFILWHLDSDRGGLATLTAIVTVLLMVLLGDLATLNWLELKPKVLAEIIGGYFAGGAIWSVVKWALFAGKRREKYDERKIEWLKQHGINDSTDIPDNLKEAWKEELLADREWSEGRHVTVISKDAAGNNVKTTEWRNGLKIKPLAREHKRLIITWMAYWPWSMLWAAIDDLVRHIFKHIQRALNDLMDRIATFVFRHTEKDFAPTKQ